MTDDDIIGDLEAFKKSLSPPKSKVTPRSVAGEPSKVVSSPGGINIIPVDRVVAHACAKRGADAGYIVTYVGYGEYNWKAKFGDVQMLGKALNFLMAQARVGNISWPVNRSEEEGVAISLYYKVIGDNKPYEGE